MIYRERGSKNHNAMEDFQALHVITLLTWAAVSVFGTTPDISTTTGDTVNIPCVFEEGTLRNIYWYYDDGTGPQKILFLSKGEIGLGAEYANRASLQNNNSTLILKDITVADEGTYRCDVDRQGQTPVPNINTKLNVFSLRSDTQPVINPCSGADESSSCSIHANQSFTLTCRLANVYPVQDTELIWYQDGKSVSSTHDDTQNDDGTTDISRQIQVSETGIFTCNATYVSANGTENTAVSVEAWIIPPTDVPNTPGKNLTSGEITGITIGIALLVGISLAIITFFIYYRSKKQEASNRLRTSAEKGSKDEKVTLRTSAEEGSKDEKDETTSVTSLPPTTITTLTATSTPATDSTTTTTTTTTATTTPVTATATTTPATATVNNISAIATASTTNTTSTTSAPTTAASTSAYNPPQEGQQQETAIGPSAANSANRSDKREVTNDEITSLTKILPAGKYNELCEKLGFGYNYVQNTLKKNLMDPVAAFKEILQEWKNNGGYMEDLDAALKKAKLGGLVSKYKK